MRKTAAISLAIFATGLFYTLGSSTSAEVSAQKGGETMAFTINSTAFKEGGTIPKQYTCDGTDVSPPLSWEGAPTATKSFTLIMDDPDAPVGTFNHWVLYDLPGETKALSEGMAKDPALPTGAKQGITTFPPPDLFCDRSFFPLGVGAKPLVLTVDAPAIGNKAVPVGTGKPGIECDLVDLKREGLLKIFPV